MPSLGLINSRRQVMSKLYTEGSPLVTLTLDQPPISRSALSSIKQIQSSIDNLVGAANFVTRPMSVMAIQNTGLINQAVVGAATGTLVTNSAVSFTLAVPTTVMTFYRVIADSSGNFAYVNAVMDGASNNNDETILNSLSYTNNMAIRLDNLSAGSHTAELTVDVDAGQTANIIKGQIKVFQIAV